MVAGVPVRSPLLLDGNLHRRAQPALVHALRGRPGTHLRLRRLLPAYATVTPTTQPFSLALSYRGLCAVIGLWNAYRRAAAGDETMMGFLQIEQKNQTSIVDVVYKTGDLMFLEVVAVTMSLWLVRMLTNKSREIFANICKQKQADTSDCLTSLSAYSTLIRCCLPSAQRGTRSPRARTKSAWAEARRGRIA